MKRLSIITVVFFLVTFFYNVMGQKNLAVHIGTIIPTGSFASGEDDSYLSNATIGLNIGGEYTFSLKKIV